MRHKHPSPAGTAPVLLPALHFSSTQAVWEGETPPHLGVQIWPAVAVRGQLSNGELSSASNNLISKPACSPSSGVFFYTLLKKLIEIISSLVYVNESAAGTKLLINPALLQEPGKVFLHKISNIKPVLTDLWTLPA